MTYKLWLDDIRIPPDNHVDWRIARSYDDAIWYVKSHGIPYFISFDHDLAEIHYILDPDETIETERTGYTFAKWFSDYVMLNEIDLPENFNYSVHSMNPVGAKNIRDYMEEFFRHYRQQT